MCAPEVCPFQRATRASPCAMSSISMSSADGSSRSSRRPDSIRCQARSGTVRAIGPARAPSLSATVAAPELRTSLMPMARDQMIVDHAGGLHEGIDDGRAAEFEAALCKFFGHGARHGGFGRNLARAFVVIDLRLSVDEIP